MAKIMLTGATGFLGSHLLKILINETRDDIIILKRSFSNTEQIDSLMDNNRIKFYDLDKTSLQDISWSNVETIIHCATEYGRHSKSCYEILKTNLMFPVSLIECAIEHNVNTFINTDSFFNKRTYYSNLLNYSLSKKSLNLWLQHFSRNIKIIDLILEHIYGAYDNNDKFVEYMVQNILFNKKDEIDLTAGDQKRDFVYVDDVCRTYIAALEFSRKYNFRYKHFEVGTGKATYLRDFVNEIKRISESPVKLKFGAIPYREDEVMCSFADVTELSNIIDVETFLTPAEGLTKIINAYRKDIL